MKVAQVYLNCAGNCREAMEFYAKCLDATDMQVMTFAQAPADVKLPADAGDKILHARLVKGGVVLMASDCPPGMPLTVGNNFSVSVECNDDEEVTELFEKFAQGGTTIMPPAHTFWGAQFGMLRDRFGVNWMFSHSKAR
ncbi:MAG: VOC family protein [Acidobacteriaceae bacterium]